MARSHMQRLIDEAVKRQLIGSVVSSGEHYEVDLFREKVLLRERSLLRFLQTVVDTDEEMKARERNRPAA